jgi:hypothetical protein
MKYAFLRIVSLRVWICCAVAYGLLPAQVRAVFVTVYNGTTFTDSIGVGDAQTGLEKCSFGTCPPGGQVSGNFVISGSSGDQLGAYLHNHSVSPPGNIIVYSGQLALNFYIQNAPATNVIPAQVCNPNNTYAQAVWTTNGYIVASAVLGPGECQTYYFVVPANISPAPVLGSGLITDQPKLIQNPDGSYGLSGGGGGGGGGQIGTILGPGSGDTVYTNGYGSTTNYPAQTNGTPVYQPGYTNQGPATIYTNGDINYNTGGTTAARDDTLRAGFNTLHSDNALSDVLLGQIAQNTLNTANNTRSNSGGGGTMVSITNINNNSVSNYLSWTNLVTITNDVPTNSAITSNELAGLAGQLQVGESNGLTGKLDPIWAATNTASTLGDAIHVDSGGLPISPEDGGGGDPGVIDITLPSLASGASTVIHVGSNTPSFGPMRTVFVWCIYATLFFLNYRLCVEGVVKIMNTPQATTAGEEIFGTNVNLASALSMAGAIVSLASVVGTAIIAKAVLDAGTTFTVNPNTVFATYGWAKSFVENYFPLGLLVTAVCSHMVFRFLIDVPVMIAEGIVKFLVGA